MPTVIENCSIQRCPCSEKQGFGKALRQVLASHSVSLYCLFVNDRGSERVCSFMVVLGKRTEDRMYARSHAQTVYAYDSISKLQKYGNDTVRSVPPLF
jgi:hypothetical protein